jgi:hypothetical protein
MEFNLEHAYMYVRTLYCGFKLFKILANIHMCR